MKRCVVMLVGLISGFGCATHHPGPLSPEEAYLLPEETMTAYVGLGSSNVRNDFPARFIDPEPRLHVVGNWKWGVTDRLTLLLPVPVAGALLVEEGADRMSILQWAASGGFSSLGHVLFGFDAGLTELVRFREGIVGVAQFWLGIEHFRSDRGIRTSHRGKLAGGFLLQPWDGLLFAPAIRGEATDPISQRSRLLEPEGDDEIAFGGVTESFYADHPLLVIHIAGPWSVFENSTFTFRRGAFYEQVHVGGVLARW